MEDEGSPCVWSRDKKRKPRDGYQSVGANRPPIRVQSAALPERHARHPLVGRSTINGAEKRLSTAPGHSGLTASEAGSSAGHGHGGHYDGDESEPENSVMS